MSYTASTEAMVIHMDSYAIHCPGQTRRPYPNAAAVGSQVAGLSTTSCGEGPVRFRKRMGSNTDGEVYALGSWRIALHHHRWVRDLSGVDEEECVPAVHKDN